MKKIFSLFLLCMLLVGCNQNNHGQDKIFEQFANLDDENHVYVEASYEEVIDLFSSKSGVVIFSFSNCPYCQVVVPILNDSAKLAEIDKILYFDIYEMRKNNTTEYQTLVETISEQVDDLAFDETNINRRIIVPDVYFVLEGKILSHHVATLKDDNDQWIRDLSKSQIVQLSTIYQEAFKKIK